jgi:hypothetical protein
MAKVSLSPLSRCQAAKDLNHDQGVPQAVKPDR